MAMISTSAAPSALFGDHLELLQCPACEARLRFDTDDGSLRCAGGSHVFRSEDGIPLLFWPADWTAQDDVTEIVRQFYEHTPFPNYDDIDSGETLRAKAERGVFARLLNEQVGYGARILEAGCGTGQLSNFLGLQWGRVVFGSDLCLNSLKLAQNFKTRNSIGNVWFLQQNLFRVAFRPEVFDLVICNGVLHHTSDPFRGFQSLVRVLKPGGHIVIGLYNTWGRLTTDIRRLIFRLTGDRLQWLDPRLRLRGLGDQRKHTWFMDQYKHPHESKHTIGEVLEWFTRTGVTFVNGIPKCSATDTFSSAERLFEPSSPGRAVDHFVVQASLLLTGGREGGFFTMIGQKQ
jgi:SAM-dependent methyltransferase